MNSCLTCGKPCDTGEDFCCDKCEDEYEECADEYDC
jgi:hypothetical protein